SMIVQDQDGVLGMDDLQEGDRLRGFQVPENAATGPAALVGRPLDEVDRYYTERALELTNGNREEAARLLGIGERTLYRNIQDWKMQDNVKAALRDAGGDLAAAAKQLGMSEESLGRKIKKWGMKKDKTNHRDAENTEGRHRDK